MQEALLSALPALTVSVTLTMESASAITNHTATITQPLYSLRSLPVVVSLALLHADGAHHRRDGAQFSQPAVRRGQPGGLWLRPLPEGGAAALLRPPAHERHGGGEVARRQQGDGAPPAAGVCRRRHRPDRGAP